jgi:hypothetical protein
MDSEVRLPETVVPYERFIEVRERRGRVAAELARPPRSSPPGDSHDGDFRDRALQRESPKNDVGRWSGLSASVRRAVLCLTNRSAVRDGVTEKAETSGH